MERKELRCWTRLLGFKYPGGLVSLVTMNGSGLWATETGGVSHHSTSICTNTHRQVLNQTINDGMADTQEKTRGRQVKREKTTWPAISDLSTGRSRL